MESEDADVACNNIHLGVFQYQNINQYYTVWNHVCKLEWILAKHLCAEYTCLGHLM